ncbi:hypothetical protein OAE59_01630 [Synechococcus sp. AH-551-B05]|nr:hypothetical protein [Synechococcus sp. AH-551-B05]MDB4677317.1 hypothetical protein [Synechococcus sp. AH-551-B05]
MLDELKNQIFIADAELVTLRSLAVQLGESDMELDLASVVLTIEKALHEKFDWELKAKAAGYQSVDMALTALSEVRAYSKVPSEFTTAPSQWLVSRSANKNDQSSHEPISVTATQAQELLNKLHPLIAEFCDGATEASIQSLREGFFCLSYNDFSTELLRIIIEDRGKNNAIKQLDTNAFCPPVGELILAYEDVCRPWLQSNNDFQMLVKFAKYPIRMDLVDQASELDELNNSQNAEIATLLISTSFYELASIGLEEVTGYELNHPGELPTKGQLFLERLKQIGLQESIKDYQEALID